MTEFRRAIVMLFVLLWILIGCLAVTLVRLDRAAAAALACRKYAETHVFEDGHTVADSVDPDAWCTPEP